MAWDKVWVSYNKYHPKGPYTFLNGQDRGQEAACFSICLETDLDEANKEAVLDAIRPRGSWSTDNPYPNTLDNSGTIKCNKCGYSEQMKPKQIRKFCPACGSMNVY